MQTSDTGSHRADDQQLQRLMLGISVITLFFLGVPLSVRVLGLLHAPSVNPSSVVDFLYDDGYYYLSIAANLAETGRSTLDGHTLTNGYQPLWLLILSVLAKLVGTRSPWSFFLASCFLIYLIALAAPISAIVWCRRLGNAKFLGLGAGIAMAVVQCPDVFLRGLEPILFVPIFIPLIVLVESKTSTRNLIALSGVLSLAFLTRLDALALYAASIIVIAHVSMPAQGRLFSAAFLSKAGKIAAWLSVVVIPTVAIYLVVNQWLFGTAVPVSGLAKMIGGARFANWGATMLFVGNWRSLGLLGGLLLALEAMMRFRGKPDALYWRSIAIVTMAIAMQCVYYGAFSTWYLWPWYAYLPSMMMALLVARILHLVLQLPTGVSAVPMKIVALAVLGLWGIDASMRLTIASQPRDLHDTSLSVGGIAGKQPGDEGQSYNQASLIMLKEFFASDVRSTVAMGDRAGGLAYWGRDKLSLVQTEGLTLDLDYIAARKGNDGARYLLTRYPIEYLIIDRESVPTVVDDQGRVQYVVAEPIQGRVTFGAVTVFCFPEAALRYKQTYRTNWATNIRAVFEFAQQTNCSAAANALVKSIEEGIGLRQFSLPSEYVSGLTGSRKMLEDWDRHRAIRHWTD